MQQRCQELTIINAKIKNDLNEIFIPLLKQIQALFEDTTVVPQPIQANVNNGFQAHVRNVLPFLMATKTSLLPKFTFIDQYSQNAKSASSSSQYSAVDKHHLSSMILNTAMQHSFQFLQDLFTGTILNDIEGINDIESFKRSDVWQGSESYQLINNIKELYDNEGHEKAFIPLLTTLSELNEAFRISEGYFDSYPEQVTKNLLLAGGLSVLIGYLEKTFQFASNFTLQNQETHGLPKHAKM